MITHPSICYGPSIFPSIFPSIHLCMTITLNLTHPWFIHPFMCFDLSIRPSMHLYIHQPTIHTCIYNPSSILSWFIHTSIIPHLSIHSSIHLCMIHLWSVINPSTIHPSIYHDPWSFIHDASIYKSIHMWSLHNVFFYNLSIFYNLSSCSLKLTPSAIFLWAVRFIRGNSQSSASNYLYLVSSSILSTSLTLPSALHLPFSKWTSTCSFPLPLPCGWHLSSD